MKKFKVAYLLLVLSGLSFNNALAGDDAKTAPGSICSAYYGSQQKLVSTSGNTQLVANETVWVSCPILEDRSEKNNKSNSFEVKVYLYHPDARTTTCNFGTSVSNGDGIVKKLSVSAPGDKKIHYRDKSYRYQNTSVSCLLAKGTRIQSLWWVERD
jgi:hypothetical protein